MNWACNVANVMLLTLTHDAAGAMFQHQGDVLKKINVYIALAIALLCSTATQASDQINEFLGVYYGGKLGINHSKATGTINAPGESTVAYIMQGGYIQGGYSQEYGVSVISVGGYVDLHGYERHSNGVAYGGHAYGLDARLALPVGHWLPYVKLGYGYSAGTGDLSAVRQYGFNKTAGVEYKFEPHWSVIAEYKINNFRNNSTAIENGTFLLGFNYYLDEPAVPEPEPEIELELPVAAPDTPPEFAPPP